MGNQEIIHTFTIDEKYWQHENKKGHPDYHVSLLGDDGKMCCLGFFAKSCGVSEENIRGRSEPSDVKLKNRTQKFSDFCIDESGSNKDVIEKLITINDGIGFNLKDRKRKIKETFLDMGVKVKFTRSK